MNYILDIDGVMVHANPHKKVELDDDGFYKFSSRAIHAFNEVFDPDHDEIILSSSHRFKYNLNHWKGIFAFRGINLIKISIMNNNLIFQNQLVSRRYEIEHWISVKNLNYDNLIIIDDDKSLNALPKDLKGRLVLTKPYVGLMDVDEIRKVLNC